MHCTAFAKPLPISQACFLLGNLPASLANIYDAVVADPTVYQLLARFQQLQMTLAHMWKNTAVRFDGQSHET